MSTNTQPAAAEGDLSINELNLIWSLLKIPKDELIEHAKSMNGLPTTNKSGEFDKSKLKIPIYICHLAYWLDLTRRDIERLSSRVLHSPSNNNGRVETDERTFNNINALRNHLTALVEKETVLLLGPQDEKSYRVEINLDDWTHTFIPHLYGTKAKSDY